MFILTTSNNSNFLFLLLFLLGTYSEYLTFARSTRFEAHEIIWLANDPASHSQIQTSRLGRIYAFCCMLRFSHLSSTFLLAFIIYFSLLVNIFLVIIIYLFSVIRSFLLIFLLICLRKVLIELVMYVSLCHVLPVAEVLSPVLQAFLSYLIVGDIRNVIS